MTNPDRQIERTPVIIRSVMSLDEGRDVFLVLLADDPNKVVAQFSSANEAKRWIGESAEFVLAP